MMPEDLVSRSPPLSGGKAVSPPSAAAENIDGWLQKQREHIEPLMVDAVRARASTPAQQATIDRLVADYRSEALFAVDFVVPIQSALGGNDEAGAGLAVALGLNWAGSHCLDDLQDGDLAGPWAELSRAEVMFASLAVALVIPPEIIADLPVADSVRRRLHTSWRGCVLDLAAGQTEDLDRVAGADEDAPLEDVAESVGRREPFGWWMRMAAELAGAPPEAAEAYHGFGHHWGIALSARKDFTEVVLHRDFRDLRNGTRTLHLTICEERMGANDRAEFRTLIEAARTDPEAREAVCRILRRERHIAALRDFLVDRLARASACLARAHPPEPLATHLHRLATAPVCA
jgi:hypothetical protein